MCSDVVSMYSELHQRFDRSPASHQPDDIWARLCCEQAMAALEAGNYGVGALLVDANNELICVARNQVFRRDTAERSTQVSGYQSGRHAEMELLDRLETEFAHLNRRELTLYVSLEPCLMCSGRILLSGIGRVRYLAADKAGGFISHLHGLPPAWKNLASGVEVEEALIQGYWRNFAHDCVEQSAALMQEKVVQAWKGGSEKS